MSIIKQTYIVPKQDNPVRFNVYCEEYVTAIPSRKGVKKAIKKGELRLNSEVVPGGTWLNENDVITLLDLELTPPKTYDLKLEILFEDEDLAVINKPAGISVSGNQYKTIQNALGYNIKKSNLIDALNWALPVHRLDNQTSGLLIIAKTKLARKNLGLAFENKTIEKIYQAVVIGDSPENGRIEKPIENKKAVSDFTKLKMEKSLKNNYLSLLELKPKTGRTHQLRIHCATINLPILGDKLYGKEGMILKHKGLFLAAVSIMFSHPRSNEKITITIPTPYKFLKRMENEAKRFEKFHSKK